MGPGYFILAIMGCGDGAALCEDIREAEPIYRTQALPAWPTARPH